MPTATSSHLKTKLNFRQLKFLTKDDYGCQMCFVVIFTPRLLSYHVVKDNFGTMVGDDHSDLFMTLD